MGQDAAVGLRLHQREVVDGEGEGLEDGRGGQDRPGARGGQIVRRIGDDGQGVRRGELVGLRPQRVARVGAGDADGEMRGVGRREGPEIVAAGADPEYGRAAAQVD